MIVDILKKRNQYWLSMQAFMFGTLKMGRNGLRANRLTHFCSAAKIANLL